MIITSRKHGLITRPLYEIKYNIEEDVIVFHVGDSAYFFDINIEEKYHEQVASSVYPPSESNTIVENSSIKALSTLVTVSVLINPSI